MGIALIAQRKYNRALKCFEKCYSIKKNDYEVILNISFLFLKSQFYQQSIEFSQKAIEIDPEKPNAYQNQATCFFFLNRLDEAEENVLKSIDIRGGLKNANFYNVVDLRRLYADILLAQQKPQEFCDYVLELLELTFDINLLTKLHRENPNLIQKKHLELVELAIKNSVHYKVLLIEIATVSAYFFLQNIITKTIHIIRRSLC